MNKMKTHTAIALQALRINQQAMNTCIYAAYDVMVGMDYQFNEHFGLTLVYQHEV